MKRYVIERHPELTLAASDVKRFDLSEAWRRGPAVLVFLRHFGCGCAWERAERLLAEIPELTAAGATVIALGQADPERTLAFQKQTNLSCVVLSDGDRQAYEAFGLLEAKPSQVVYGMADGFLPRDPSIGEHFLKTRQASGRPPVDSPWQLPGEFVVDRAGVTRLAYRSQYCADYAHPAVLVAAIREAVLGL